MSALSLATTDAIITELKRRYPLLLVAWSADTTKECSIEILYYQGPVLSLLGLTDVVHYDLIEQYDNALEDAQDIP